MIKFQKDNSFFLFRARSTGKTYLLKERFETRTGCYIDLLNPDQNEAFSLRTRTLTEQLAALKPEIDWVIIDEI